MPKKLGKMGKENRKLHDIWRTHVLARDKHCVICGPKGRWTPQGKVKLLNAHHLIPKEFAEYRWKHDNGMTLCVHHHTLGKLSAHKHPMWFIWWLLINKPDVARLMKERTSIYIEPFL